VERVAAFVWNQWQVSSGIRNPENPSVTLQTLQSAAQALGGHLIIELDFRSNAV
jgi:hypothetical protein